MSVVRKNRYRYTPEERRAWQRARLQAEVERNGDSTYITSDGEVKPRYPVDGWVRRFIAGLEPVHKPKQPPGGPVTFESDGPDYEIEIRPGIGAKIRRVFSPDWARRVLKWKRDPGDKTTH